MPTKYPEIAGVLRSRLDRGDYALNRLPSGRKLAAELGVSYLTARRAIAHLIEGGELVREDNGRLRRAEQHPVRDRPLNIAFLMPANPSASSGEWRIALSEVVEERGGVVRPISYVHPDDPVITEAINAEFDGIFLVQPRGVATVLLDRLARERHRIVMVWNGADDLEIPCLDGGAPDAIDELVLHLRELGHRRIDCFNTMHHGTVVSERIERWRSAVDRFGLEGELHEDPCEFMGNPAPLARRLALRVWADGPPSTAVFCPTVAAVHGLYRAAWEMRLWVGQDVSICSFGSHELAELFTPSLTTVETAPLKPLLTRGLDWIVSGGKQWDGPWRLAPTDLKVFKGESTGPAPA
ncbi:MAG: substrate-binding domain-containing protein [Planctomycetota bacterium]